MCKNRPRGRLHNNQVAALAPPNFRELKKSGR